MNICLVKKNMNMYLSFLALLVLTNEMWQVMKGNKLWKDNEFGVEVWVFLHKIDCVLNGLWIYWVGSHIGTCDDLTILVYTFNILYPNNEKMNCYCWVGNTINVMIFVIWSLFQKDVKLSPSIWLLKFKFISNWSRGNLTFKSFGYVINIMIFESK